MENKRNDIIPKQQNDGNELVRRIAEQKYEFGFTTDIHTEIIEKGLNEDIIRLISAKKGEPEWMLEFRLKAFRYCTGKNRQNQNGDMYMFRQLTIKPFHTMPIPWQRNRRGKEK